MKKALLYIINSVMLIFFIGICKILNGKIIDKKLLFLVLIILVALLIIRRIMLKNSMNKWLEYYINLFCVGYKISLIFIVLEIGIIQSQTNGDFNNYLICFIPSILYILDTENINDMIKIFHHDIFY